MHIGFPAPAFTWYTDRLSFTSRQTSALPAWAMSTHWSWMYSWALLRHSGHTSIVVARVFPQSPHLTFDGMLYLVNCSAGFASSCSGSWVGDSFFLLTLFSIVRLVPFLPTQHLLSLVSPSAALSSLQVRPWLPRWGQGGGVFSLQARGQTQPLRTPTSDHPFPSWFSCVRPPPFSVGTPGWLSIGGMETEFPYFGE